jgi:DNA-binding transcriptional regulator YhcF (GntR family)
VILTVDISSDIPIYQQLRDRVVEAIADGRLTTGDSLPATRALAADFGINFHTVNKAYDVLRRQGLVRLARKTGAVISRDPGSGPPDAAFIEDWTARARTLLAEAVANGMPPGEAQERLAGVLDGFKGRTS